MWLFNPCSPDRGSVKLQEVDPAPPWGVFRYPALPPVFRFTVAEDHPLALADPDAAGEWVLPRHFPYSEFRHGQEQDDQGFRGRLDALTYRQRRDKAYIEYELLYLETLPEPDETWVYADSETTTTTLDITEFLDWRLTVAGTLFEDGDILPRATLLSHLQSIDEDLIPLGEAADDRAYNYALQVMITEPVINSPFGTGERTIDIPLALRVLRVRSTQILAIDQLLLADSTPWPVDGSVPEVRYHLRNVEGAYILPDGTWQPVYDFERYKLMYESGWCLRWWLKPSSPWGPLVLSWRDLAVFWPLRTTFGNPGFVNPLQPHVFQGAAVTWTRWPWLVPWTNDTQILPLRGIDPEVDYGKITVLPGWP